MDFFQYAFMQRALIAGLFVALSCSLIGVFLVLRRLSLIGDGLAHIAFGGLALGLFTGLPPMITALGTTVLGALCIQWLKQKKVAADAAIAVIFSMGLALGVVLVSLARGFNIDLFSFLFGSILAVSEADLFTVGVLGVVVVAAVIIFYKELLYITFDEEAAKASGLPIGFLNALLMVLTAITVIVAMRVVGVLLVSSLIVLPTITVRLFSRSFKQTLVYSALFGLLSVFLGLFAAFYLDIAAGGAIVLVAGALFLLVSLLHKLLNRNG
jgi:zinc transport system permease protein